MHAMTRSEMIEIEGEGFLGGLGCGLAIAVAFTTFVSPEPFSKVALLTYGGTAIGCIAAF